MPRIDVTGEKYGRLTAIKYVMSGRNRRSIWLFRCDCGNLVEKDLGDVRSGNTLSCGCIHREQLAERNRKNVKHGGDGTRLYFVWHHMKQRCLRPEDKSYARYGGRGITVCDEWVNDFAAFRDWAMANGYDPDAPYGKCTLDRIDNDKGYSPENCRWVDFKTQARNRRNGYEIYNLKGHKKKSHKNMHVCG